MKNLKKAIIFLIWAVIVPVVAGCSNKLGKPDEIINTMQKNMEKAKNLEVDYKADLDMKMGESPLKMQVGTTMAYFKEPLKAKVEMTVNNDEKDTRDNMQMYFTKNKKNECYTYAYADKEWFSQKQKEETFQSELERYLTKFGIERYAGQKDTLKKTGEEKINSKDTVVLEGKISGDLLENVLNAEETIAQFKSVLGEDGVVKDSDSASVRIWVDKKTILPVKISIDVAPVMKTIMESVAEKNKKKDVKVEINKYILELNFTSIGKAKNFEIPKEALTAK